MIHDTAVLYQCGLCAVALGRVVNSIEHNLYVVGAEANLTVIVPSAAQVK